MASTGSWSGGISSPRREVGAIATRMVCGSVPTTIACSIVMACRRRKSPSDPRASKQPTVWVVPLLSGLARDGERPSEAVRRRLKAEGGTERTLRCVSRAYRVVEMCDAAGESASEQVYAWGCAGGHHRICMVADRAEENRSGAIPFATRSTLPPRRTVCGASSAVPGGWSHCHRGRSTSVLALVEGCDALDVTREARSSGDRRSHRLAPIHAT